MKEKLTNLIAQLQDEYELLKKQENELGMKRHWSASERAEIKADLLLNVISRLIKIAETI